MASENLQPQIIARIMTEIRELVRNPPDGIAYVENEDSSVSEIYATITGPEGTPFSSGKFMMKLVLSEDYPTSPPKGYFLTRIFHPNVSTHGDICVNTLKRDWNVDVTIRHILQVIRCLLIVPFPESSLNDEAGKLFMDSYEEYARRARLLTEVHALPNPNTCGEGKAGDSGETDGQTGGTGALSPSATQDIDDDVTALKSGSVASSVGGLGGTSSVEGKKEKTAKDTKRKNLKRL